MGIGSFKGKGHIDMIGYSKRYKAIVVSGMHIIQKYDVAIKIIPKKQLSIAQNDEIRELIKLYRLVTHEHVVKLHDAFESPNYYYLCMEKLHEQSLWEIVQKEEQLTEDKAV